MTEIRRIDFSEIKPVWSQHLWDSRYQFAPTSAMLFLGGYDPEIATKYKPYFFSATVDGEQAGVVSGHATSESHFRVRGLFVFEPFRGRNVGRDLVHAVISEGNNQGREFLWSAPRESALDFYKNLGFKVYSPFTREGFLYGPNCYVGLNLKD